MTLKMPKLLLKKFLPDFCHCTTKNKKVGIKFYTLVFDITMSSDFLDILQKYFIVNYFSKIEILNFGCQKQKKNEN